MELPPDDAEGPSFATSASDAVKGASKRKPASAKTGQKKKKATNNRAPCVDSLPSEPLLGCDLPPDDLGVLPHVLPHAVHSEGRVVRKVKSKAKTPGSQRTESETNALPWTDERLKDAACQIPSVTWMPYLDLMGPWTNPSPVPPPDVRDDLWEIYSVPRFGPAIRALGGTSKRSYDLRNFWDLGLASYKRTLLQDLTILRPFFASLSPPCKFLCLLMASNWSRMRKTNKYLSLKEGLEHIDLTSWIAQFQANNDAYFGFEHPQGSLAWSRDSASCIV